MSLFLSAFLLGLLFNAAPGAVFAETIRQGASSGFRPALAVQVGSLLGDAGWAILGLTGVGIFLQLDALRVPIGIVGAAYLLWLAWDSWCAANTHFSITLYPNESRFYTMSHVTRACRKGAVLSLTNPQNIAYWAALGSALGAVGVTKPTISDYTLFFAGFMCSSVVWAFFCAAVIARIFKNAKLGWVKLTYKLCAMTFLLLALASVKSLLQENPTELTQILLTTRLNIGPNNVKAPSLVPDQSNPPGYSRNFFGRLRFLHRSSRCNSLLVLD